MNNLQVSVAGAPYINIHLTIVLRKSTTNAPMEDNRDASLCALFLIAGAGHTVLGPSVEGVSGAPRKGR